MRSLFLVALVFAVSGCGYSSRNNEVVGQAKKVVNLTPILCSDRIDTDISLGVMRNGVGSMSTQDAWFTVPKESDQKLLNDAASAGKLVKVNYDVKRWVWCWQDHIITHVEILKD